MDSSLKADLSAFGHELTNANSDEVGVSQIISRDLETGTFTGAHDPRVPGMAAGVAAVPAELTTAQ